MKDENYIRKIADKIREKVNSTSSRNDMYNELFDTYAVLALAKGKDVNDEDVHDAWSAWAIKYKPDSKSLVPFEELSLEVRAKDTKYAKAIREVSIENLLK